jgi:hypothetical protein
LSQTFGLKNKKAPHWGRVPAFQHLFEFSFNQFHRIAVFLDCCKDNDNNLFCQNYEPQNGKIEN